MSASHFLIIFKAEPVLHDVHPLEQLSEKSLVIKPRDALFCIILLMDSKQWLCY